MDLELHFNIDFIHLTAAEGYIETLCYLSLGMSLLAVLCFRISVFPLLDGLRVLIGQKTRKNVHVLGKAMASYAVVKKC